MDIDVNKLPMVEQTEVWEQIALIPTNEQYDDCDAQWFHVIGYIDGKPAASLGMHDIIQFERDCQPIVDMLLDGTVSMHLLGWSKMLVECYTSACLIGAAK